MKRILALVIGCMMLVMSITSVSAMTCPNGHEMTNPTCHFTSISNCRAEQIMNCVDSEGCYYYYAPTRWSCRVCGGFFHDDPLDNGGGHVCVLRHRCAKDYSMEFICAY